MSKNSALAVLSRRIPKPKSVDLLHLRCLVRSSPPPVPTEGSRHHHPNFHSSSSPSVRDTKLDHFATASRKRRWLRAILTTKVRSTICSALSANAIFLQLHHRRQCWVVLHSVLGHHVRTHGTVVKCVCFQRTLNPRPNHSRSPSHPNLDSKYLLDEPCQWLKLGIHLLHLLIFATETKFPPS